MPPLSLHASEEQGDLDPVETKQLLDKLVVIKLNGDLGTKMVFSGPRSTTEVCNGLTYLDLIINQIEGYIDHRELFLSLKNTGTLETLLLQGKEYILVVKNDNLRTLIDSSILVGFMEVL